MCEIFPDVPNCCLCIDYRTGMLFISVLAIMTGVTLLCIMEQRTGASYHGIQKKVKTVTKDVKKNANKKVDAKHTKALASKMATLVPAGISAMAGIFMFVGIVLFIAVILDQEGLVQIFVWVTFLNTIIGFVLIAAVGLECMALKTCLLQGMDWLSSAGVMLIGVCYLFLWIYFIIVSNSYVLNVYS